MKKMFIAVLAATWLIHGITAAEIRNGYETDIRDARLAYRYFSKILENEHDDEKHQRKLSPRQREKAKLKRQEMKKLIVYYDLTEKLLTDFRVIAPELYHEIDTLRDAKGNINHVYVRLMNAEDMYLNSKGWAGLDPDKPDNHVCRSAFGNHSVSVAICANRQSLRTLAHEFGHVRYLVPHLSTYIDFYKKRYHKKYFDTRCIGHCSDDPCGKMADYFLERFRQSYKIYRKMNSRGT